MALHAGFAAALSFTTEALQALIHAAYVNNVIPGKVKGSYTISNDTVKIAYDFSLAEPKANLTPTGDLRVGLLFDFLGNFTLSSVGKPTLTTEVRMVLEGRFDVIVAQLPGNDALQFCVETALMSPGSSSVHVVSGDDPVPVYGYDPTGVAAVIAVLIALSTAAPRLVLTPPQLAHFAKLGYALGPLRVNITQDSLNLGVDIKGMTAGNVLKLVDLNRLSTAKGWKKTLYQAVHTADDEYGEPIYDTQWGNSALRKPGAHNTAIAVSLNQVVFQDIFHRRGRYEVFVAFETAKYQARLAAVDLMSGATPSTSYEPSQLELTVLDALDIALHTDYVQITGTGSNYDTLAAHVGFALKTRLVRTFFDGDTQFVVRYARADGISAEHYDVDVGDPGWIAPAIILGLVTGVNILPDSSAVALAVSVIQEMVAGIVVGDLLGKKQDDLVPATLDSMSGFRSTLAFKLPGTPGPGFEVFCDDVVVRPDGLTGWFDLAMAGDRARIFLKNYPGYSGEAAIEHVSWSATDLAKIVVRYSSDVPQYNPYDTRVRMRWQVFGDTIANAILDDDQPIATQSTEISIDHASAALVGYKTFIVRCRIYRPWDQSTDELFNQELDIAIEDLLDRVHPYVHWQHVVHYQSQELGWVTVNRRSKIHYTNPARRCRFADRFSPHVSPGELIYSDGLPFDLADIAQHRREICPYCFFGGPDKTVLK